MRFIPKTFAPVSPGVRKLSVLALVATAYYGTAAHSAAQTFTNWDPIFQGIDFATGSESSGEQLYAMRIDLQTAGISFETTPSSPSAVSQGYETYSQTTGAFMTSVGAQVAINANFFSNVQTTSVPEDLLGLAVSDGSTVSPADSNFQSLFLTASNAATIGSPTTGSIYNAVSGVQDLVNGVAVTPNTTSGDPTGLDPRTDVGLSQNGEYLYFLAADGRSTQSPGITDLNAGQVLASLGAYNGLNLDGGGSTTMVQSNGSGGATVLNVPSGGTQRLDGNSLAVFAKALVTTPVSTSGTYSQAVLNYNPALYYQLNETSGSTAYDSSGNGHNGSYPASGVTLGKTSTPIVSQPGTTIATNGTTGAKVVVPYNSSMSSGSFTIAAWANPNANATSFGAVVSERDDKGSGAAGNSGFILYDGPATGSSSSVWQFWTGGNQTLTYNYEGRNQSGEGLGPVATPGQWAFVVGTFSATSGPNASGYYTGTQDLYVNGVLKLTLNNVSYLPDTSTSLYIGAGANEAATDQFDFNGGISQVALYDNALTTSQIDAIYSAGVTPNVPEPRSYALLIAGLGALILVQRWRSGAQDRSR
jgi:exopolysaccharide biosynthesis protein